jgi:DNA-binding XRE family transcriptional regulator
MGKKLSELKSELMTDEVFKKEYESLEQEFNFAAKMIEARLQEQLSQEQVARRMGTTQSVVARIESGRPLPSMRTLMRYAAAVGRTLDISLPKAA